MKYSFKYILYSISFMLSGVIHSQNYTDDVNKITGAFRKGDISFHMKYRFYPYDSINVAKDSLNVYCCISGAEYYYKVATTGGAYEYCKNSKYYFVIDHEESAIEVKRSTGAASQQLWDINKFDSLVHSPDIKISYKTIDKNEGEYDISIKNNSWDKVKLVFNTSTYLPEKMIMYSKAKGKLVGTEFKRPRIEISYSGYSSKELNKKVFSEDRFFYDNSSAIVVRDAFKKYKLFDYVYKLKIRS